MENMLMLFCLGLAHDLSLFTSAILALEGSVKQHGEIEFREKYDINTEILQILKIIISREL